MKAEHAIVAAVYAAKDDSLAADELVRQYLPFIKAETAKFIRRIPLEGQDDELSIAMFAFHEAVMAYSSARGAFLPFAATAIRNRLIDYSRRERRHASAVSLDSRSDEDGSTLLEKLDTGEDEIGNRLHRSATKEEIMEFSETLHDYGLDLADIAANCPKQERTLRACHRALAYAKAHPELLDTLTETKRLPISALAAGAGVERKTLERHRKYMVAIMLAYTNGFTIIRGHLKQLAPVAGGLSA